MLAQGPTAEPCTKARTTIECVVRSRDSPIEDNGKAMRIRAYRECPQYEMPTDAQRGRTESGRGIKTREHGSKKEWRQREEKQLVLPGKTRGREDDKKAQR